MAGLSITGQMKVSTLQDGFLKEFGLTLRIYDGRSFADPTQTLAQVRKKKGSGKALSVAKNMKVGNLEDKFEEEFGLKVQVAGSDDSYLCDNDLTLNGAQQEDEKKLSRKERKVGQGDLANTDENDSDGLKNTINEQIVDNEDGSENVKILRFEIDCRDIGPTGHNMTEQPLDSLTPYLYRLDVKGKSENVSIESADPIEAKFQVIEMTDVRMVQGEIDETQVTIFFRAVVEFTLGFDPDDEFGGKYFERLLEEAGWAVHVSSDTMGLETSDGAKDNDSFDGIWDAVKVDLKKLNGDGEKDDLDLGLDEMKEKDGQEKNSKHVFMASINLYTSVFDGENGEFDFEEEQCPEQIRKIIIDEVSEFCECVSVELDEGAPCFLVIKESSDAKRYIRINPEPIKSGVTTQVPDSIRSVNVERLAEFAAKNILWQGEENVVVAMLVNGCDHWDYNFLKVSQGYSEKNFWLIGWHENSNDYAVQGIEDGDFDTGIESEGGEVYLGERVFSRFGLTAEDFDIEKYR